MYYKRIYKCQRIKGIIKCILENIKNVQLVDIKNEFRGVLCSACNKGIGLLKDSIVILNNAVAYLKNKGSYNTVTLET